MSPTRHIALQGHSCRSVLLNTPTSTAFNLYSADSITDWRHMQGNEFTGRTSVICRCEMCFRVQPPPYFSTTPTLIVAAIFASMIHTNCHMMETPNSVTESRFHAVLPPVCIHSNISLRRRGRPHWPGLATSAGRASVANPAIPLPTCLMVVSSLHLH